MKKYIHTSNAPEAVGPYSQAAAANGMVFTSGQIAIDPETQQIISGGVEEQTHQVCKNIAAILEAAGSSLEEVVKTTLYLRSMEDFAVVNAVYSEYFTSKPARTTVPTASFPESIMIEIDCIALLKSDE